MQPNCDVKRFDAKHFTQHKLYSQFSAYPACWGAPAPKPPSPNKDATVLNQFSSSFSSRYTSAFSGCLLVFLAIRSTIFSPFCRVLYNISHIKYSKHDQRAIILPKNDNDNEKRYRKINTACNEHDSLRIVAIAHDFLSWGSALTALGLNLPGVGAGRGGSQSFPSLAQTCSSPFGKRTLEGPGPRLLPNVCVSAMPPRRLLPAPPPTCMNMGRAWNRTLRP